MTIHSTYSRDRKTYSISVGTIFDFSDYKEFKEVYEKLPIDATHIELDLRRTNHIDSSALGMMLLMNERVQDQIPQIDVVNSNPGVRKIFNLSHFKTIFNITAN